MKGAVCRDESSCEQDNRFCGNSSSSGSRPYRLYFRSSCGRQRGVCCNIGCLCCCGMAGARSRSHWGHRRSRHRVRFLSAWRMAAVHAALLSVRDYSACHKTRSSSKRNPHHSKRAQCHADHRELVRAGGDCGFFPAGIRHADHSGADRVGCRHGVERIRRSFWRQYLSDLDMAESHSRDQWRHQFGWNELGYYRVVFHCSRCI